MAKRLTDSLIDAASEHDAERVRSLLAKGADPNARAAQGRTALYGAAGNASVIRLLVEAGADPNIESEQESEGLPLCFAACWGASEAVRALLDAGADPNLREDAGRASGPLHWAADGGTTEVVEALLEAGADPNLDANGRIPLHLAAERGSVSIVRALLAAGANPDATSAEGRTALQIAEEWAGKDLEAELRRDVERFAREGDKIVTRREPRPGGVELVEVTAFSPDGSGLGAERETGHAEIVALLRNRPSAD